MHTFLIFFQSGVGGLMQFLPFLLIIVIFYVLLIRPQQKRQRQLQDTIATLKIGDRVVTTGGVIGVITTVRDTSFLIRSADKSILETLEEADIPIMASCYEGVCGTCEARVLEGTPDHRDSMLTEPEKAAGEVMLVCVSRSRTERLVLDL